MGLGFAPRPPRRRRGGRRWPPLAANVCTRFSAEFEELRFALERRYAERLRDAEAPDDPLGHLADADAVDAGGRSAELSGPTRHQRLNYALDHCGVERHKGQRYFHLNMTQAAVRKLYKDDFAEHQDTLRTTLQLKPDENFRAEVLIITPRRWGKCLGADDRVLLADGGTARAADVRVGALLVGDDWRPRVVLNTCTGRAPLFRVHVDGVAFTCNDAHLLVLEMRGARAYVRVGAEFEVVERQFGDGTLAVHDVVVGRYTTFERAQREVDVLDGRERPSVTMRAADVFKQARALAAVDGCSSGIGAMALPSAFGSIRFRRGADGARLRDVLPTAIEARGVGAYYGFQCAAFTRGATPTHASAAAEALRRCFENGGAAAVEVTGALLAAAGVLVPSAADGARAADGAFPGRFVLANGIVVHNTYSVAMFVAALAYAGDVPSPDPWLTYNGNRYAVEGISICIFSTGKRASTDLLQLVLRFLKHLPGMASSIVTANVEVVQIRGPHGIDDVRTIKSFPSKVSWSAATPPTESGCGANGCCCCCCVVGSLGRYVRAGAFLHYRVATDTPR